MFFDLFVGLVDFGEFFFSGLADVLAHVADLVRVVFDGHAAVGFFDFLVGGFRGDAEHLVGGVHVVVEHGLHGAVVRVVDAEERGDAVEEADFLLADTAVGFRDAKQEVKELYPGVGRHVEADDIQNRKKVN